MEWVQQRAVKIIQKLKHVSYEGRLRELGMFSLEKIKLRGILSMCIKYVLGWSKADGTRHFSVMPSDGTRGNDHKLKHQKLHLNIRKSFFTMRSGLDDLHRSLPTYVILWICGSMMKINPNPAAIMDNYWNIQNFIQNQIISSPNKMRELYISVLYIKSQSQAHAE